MMKKLGLLINPVAGIGGKVGLKGSDGAKTLAKALALGAVPESNNKAVVALKRMLAVKDELLIVTYPHEMGEDAARRAGFEPVVIGSIESGKTTPADTKRAAVDLKDYGVDLILFAGGDGTARDVLDAVGTDIPVLGIPAGCKIHSGVYAINPRTAGDLIVQFAQGLVRDTEMAEVMDIDEDLFRENIVDAKLYGYLRIPNEHKMVQNLKSGRGLSEAATVQLLSNCLIDGMIDGVLYIVGPGSTMFKFLETMGEHGTLLGVDLVRDKKIIARDVTEKQILEALESQPDARIIVTVIGGQGYVFGRGNQQISAEVIRKVGLEHITIAASKAKMISLFGKPLYVDTGDEATNEALRGYRKVLVGYDDYHMFKVTD
jgi:predicted polyphosphate/ATP-dependent NAD kinase